MSIVSFSPSIPSIVIAGLDPAIHAMTLQQALCCDFTRYLIQPRLLF
jgi:hypothetical protein